MGISIIREISESVMLPKTYFINYPFGHAVGESFNRNQQKKILYDCLKIIESSEKLGIIVDSPYRWEIDTFD